ncbi:MAG: hypothetical protein R3E50_05210 [Halioglobus sp.]
MKITGRVRRAVVAMLVGGLLLPQVLRAQEAIDESPNEWAMVGDLLVARPIGAVLTVGGAAVWLVSLPFTLMAGSASEAAGTLIGGPAEATFVRCLGCRNPGYTGKDIEAIKKQQEREKDDEVAGS